MAAHPVPSDDGEPSAEALKQHLLRELAAARLGIAGASESLRKAGDLPARLRSEFESRFASHLRRHPLAWTTGLATAGFLAARVLFRPRPSFRAVAAANLKNTGKSSSGLAKQLLLSGAGYLLKPAIKDLVTRKVKEYIATSGHRPSRR